MRAAFPYPHCLTAGFPANHALKYDTANDTFIKEYPIGPANFYEDDERHRIHNAVPSNRLGHLTPFRTHYVDLNTGPLPSHFSQQRSELRKLPPFAFQIIVSFAVPTKPSKWWPGG